MKKSPTPFGNTVASYGTKVCNAVYLAGALTAAVFSESCEGGVLGIEEGHDIKKDTITVIDYVPVPVIPTIVMNQPNDSTACFVADYPDPLLDANL
ncbi:MAG: hypothetical protein Q8O99_00740 [bacterium]|nr:hypothetical protein [bacterium]